MRKILLSRGSIPIIFTTVGIVILTLAVPAARAVDFHQTTFGSIHQWKDGQCAGLDAVAVGKHIYLFSLDCSGFGRNDAIHCERFKMDVPSSGQNMGTILIPAETPNDDANPIAAAYYAGKFHVFFTRNRATRVYHLTATLGANGLKWDENIDWNANFLAMVNPDGGRKLKAVVFRKKLYLFADQKLSDGRSEIMYRYFNGAGWNTSNNGFWCTTRVAFNLQDFDVCAILNHSGQERLALIGLGIKTDATLYAKFYGPNYQKNPSGKTVIANGADGTDCEWSADFPRFPCVADFVAIAYGSAKECEAGQDAANCLQIWAYRTADKDTDWDRLWHCAYRVKMGTAGKAIEATDVGDKGEGGTFDQWALHWQNRYTEFPLTNFQRPCRITVPTSSLTTNSTNREKEPDFAILDKQNYLVPIMSGWYSQYCWLHSYQSDSMKVLGTAADLDGLAKEEEKDNFKHARRILLGVVEGVPPFPSHSNIQCSSEFLYENSRSKSMSSTVKTTESSDWSFGAAIEGEALVGGKLNLEFGGKGGMSSLLTSGTKNLLTSSMAVRQGNDGDNQNGDYGWAFFLEQSVLYQDSARYTAGGSKLFNSRYSWVDGVNIVREDYLLRDPAEGKPFLEGMRKRISVSSDINGWQALDKDSLGDLGDSMGSINCLQIGAGTKVVESKLASEKAVTESREHNWFEGSYIKGKLLGGGGVPGYGIYAGVSGGANSQSGGGTEEVTVETSLEGLEASLGPISVVDRSKPYVRSMTVQPYILTADPSVASWVPDLYKEQKSRPFLVTWGVTEIKWENNEAEPEVGKDIKVIYDPKTHLSLNGALQALLKEMGGKNAAEGVLEVPAAASPVARSELALAAGKKITIQAPSETMDAERRPTVVMKLGSLALPAKADLTLANLILDGKPGEGESPGQGIHIAAKGKLVMRGCDLINHDASGSVKKKGWGGGLYVAGSASLDGCSLSGNRTGADGGGGVAYVEGGTLSLANCRVTGNQAGTGGGGAIRTSKGSLSLRNSLITGNSSGLSVKDGAVHLAGNGFSYKKNTCISGNTPGDLYLAAAASAAYADDGGDGESAPDCRLVNCIVGYADGEAPLTMAVNSCIAAASEDFQINSERDNLRDVDPMLELDESGEVVGLLPDSPCAGAGRRADSPLDINGAPWDSKPDIGCFETVSPPSLRLLRLTGKILLDPNRPNRDGLTLTAVVSAPGLTISPDKDCCVRLGGLIVESEKLRLARKPRARAGAGRALGYVSKTPRGPSLMMTVKQDASSDTAVVKLVMRRVNLAGEFKDYGVDTGEPPPGGPVQLPLGIQLADDFHLPLEAMEWTVAVSKREWAITPQEQP